MPDNGEITAPEGAEQDQTEGQQQATDDDAPEDLGDAGKKALDRMKAERNEASRALKAAQRELEEARKASMSESEKAIAEAKAAGRTEAATEFGQELARERFDALAGRRNPDFDTAKALEYVDLSKFLGEDGRPDAKVIAAAVERLVPVAANTPPSFDGGTRTPAPAGSDMNQFIRKATGRA